MSSTPQSIPLNRRSQGGLAALIAVGVLLAIAATVIVLAVTSGDNPAPRTSAGTSQANVGSTARARYLGARQAGAVVNGGPSPAAGVGNTASSQAAQPNPDQQAITSHNPVPGEDLSGWLLRR
jgi:hypothetical protein